MSASLTLVIVMAVPVWMCCAAGVFVLREHTASGAGRETWEVTR